MIRLLRLLFLVVLAIVLMTVALANRAPVTLRALPEDMATLLGYSSAVELPLFLVIFGGIAAGLLIGFVWEWFREHKHRAAASTKAREVARLERELAQMRDAKGNTGGDEVLAILEQPRKAG
ncbi:LapA family protein [Aliigemmobacter aestuarii]|uniref:LapA family protein n=1 Tax=Aliigemmobacter aestuarii TaxID=1445661 RepID=A0A4S3MQM0_9RHOB|nr:LapA family protein [Gemmobacter aestuarii]THD84830.1 LapA family protein [Gemmobacter aestuarii]